MDGKLRSGQHRLVSIDSYSVSMLMDIRTLFLASCILICIYSRYSSHRIKELWKRVFDDILESSAFTKVVGDDYRGLQREEAIAIYVSSMGESRSRELFSIIKKLHSTAAMNCEGLRKLVKKFDKGALARGDDQLTSTLLHELYSASFASFTSLDTYIEILRDALVVSSDDEEDEEDSDNEIYSYQERSALTAHHDGAAVKRRADEQAWLTAMLSSIPRKYLSALVAHRYVKHSSTK